MKVPLSERMTPELVFAQYGGMNRNVMWDSFCIFLLLMDKE